MAITTKIRNEALKNNTTIQSSDEAKLEQLLNRTFYLDKDIEKETAFVKQVMTRGEESQERTGLHASSFIAGPADFCVRGHILSQFTKSLKTDTHNVGLMRIFEEGNAIHEKWQRLFIRAGFSEVEELDLTQYDKEFGISFTPDIISRIPDFYDGREMVGEIKSVNTFQFKKMKKHPSASKQLQWYMHLTGIHHGFVLNEDKNNQAFKVELYEFDPEIVEPYIARARKIKKFTELFFNEKKLIKCDHGASCRLCSNYNIEQAVRNINRNEILKY